MYSTRRKNFVVTITSDDRRAVRIVFKGALEEIDLRAVARAAGRNVVRASRCTFEALDCLTAEIPDAMISAWAANRAKRSA